MPLADRTTYLADIVAALQREWPDNHTATIVCHGHSVPAGYFRGPVVDTFNAYPHLLHRALKERYPNAVLNVVVTAIGGENAESGARRFARDVIALRPDVVTIDYALNDRGIGIDRARAAWSEMTEAAVAAGARVVLLTPTWDVAARLDDPQDPLHRHARLVRELSEAHGVALADGTDAFQRRVAQALPVKALLSQSNHPNRAGHELVVGELLRWFPLG